MKKLFLVLIVLVVLAGCGNATENEEVVESENETADVFTSASVNDFYGKVALTGDELWEAVTNHTVAGLTATTNPDGTPNVAYVMPCQATKIDDVQYFCYGVNGNQTDLNFKATGEGLLVVLGGYEGELTGPACGVGARVKFTVVTDADEIAAVRAANENIKDTNTIVKVVEVKPLG